MFFLLRSIMKTVNRSLPLVFFLTIAAFSAGLPTGLSGTWAGKQTRPEEGVDGIAATNATLKLVQTGAKVTGSISAAGATAAEVQAGVVREDNHITFYFYDPQHRLFTANLVVEANKIRGRLTSSTGQLELVELTKQ